MIQYIVHPKFVQDSKPEEIADKMKEIVDSAIDPKKLKISISDLDFDVPDENIKVAIETLMKD